MKLTHILLGLTLLIYSCKKEYDHPPLKGINDGAKITIKKMKERIPTFASSYAYTFKGGDTNLYCTVISDEVNGNFYQQVFAQDDAGGAIQINLKESGGVYTGDNIRINLNQISLVSANNMIYLDSVDASKSIVKISSGNRVQPKTTTLSQLLTYSANPGHTASLQSQLVELNGVEFKPNPLYSTFADAIGKTSVNQTLTTCEAGQTLILRTSGRSNFAGKSLPNGNGKIIGIVTQYNSTMQLTLRDYKEVNMIGPLCSSPINTNVTSAILHKDFNDFSISSGGWTVYSVSNTAVGWTTSTFSTSTTPFAKISGFTGGVNTNSENWLISPVINLSSTQNPVLTFQSAAKFSGTTLDVLVSTNYVSGNPSSGNWVSLSPNFVLSPSSGNYLWTPSGSVLLSGFKTNTTRIAFKYRSTTVGATTYELDDILVKEK